MFGSSCHGRGLQFLPLVVVVILAAVPLALAGETGKGADPAKAAALAHFETARRLYEVREYAKALEEYKAAYVAKPDPAFLFNIGQCHRKLGQNAQALDFFQQYLKKAPLDDPNRPQVEAWIADIQAEEQAKSTRMDSDPWEADRKSRVAPVPQIRIETMPSPTPPPMASMAAPSPPASLQAAATPLPEPTQVAGTDLSLAALAAPSADEKPIYGQWWFWTGVGAVVVAGAATTAYLMRSGGGTRIPSTSLGNRPVFP